MDSHLWNAPLPVFCPVIDTVQIKSRNRDSPNIV